VCTGSNAWERANSTGWLPSIPKIILPLNSDINIYKWNCAYNKDVLLVSHGIIESYNRLIELSRAILSYGAYKVVWCIPEFNIMSFISKDAAL